MSVCFVEQIVCFNIHINYMEVFIFFNLLDVMDEKRSPVVGLYRAGKTAGEIFRLLKNGGVKRASVYWTIKRYKETGSTKDRPGRGRPASALTPAAVRKVRRQLLKNLRLSVRKLSRTMEFSNSSVHRLVRNKLGFRAFKHRRVHELTEQQKRNRLAKSKALKKRFAGQTSPNIVFSDEKLFTVEQVVNHQNDRIWCKEISFSNKDQFHATRRQKPASVMVWAAVTATGR